MNDDKKITIASGLLLLFGVFVMIFVLPIMTPDIQIQCISEPCKVPKWTVYEYVTNTFFS